MHVHAPQAGKGAGRTTLVLRVSMVATLAYVVLTFVAGLQAHSLALLSESGHNVSDFLALLLSFTAVHFQSRPADHSRTFVNRGHAEPNSGGGTSGTQEIVL